MKINWHDLPAHIKRLNPHLFSPVGAVEGSKQKPDTGRALGSNAPAPKAGRARVATGGPVIRVTIIGCEHRRRDSDNPEYKALRDAIARSFELDDEDGTIAWEYCQHRTDGAEGTIVKVEVL